ncbi:MAG: molybdopterin-containing oxidoreductase family protein, partial [Bacillota bacterium]
WGLLATVENGRVVDIKGDPGHPLTRGLVCGKARKHLTRLYSKQRLLSPLKRTPDGWQTIDWPQAYREISTRLQEILARYGPQSILYHAGGGSEGLLHKLEMRFFRLLGGCSMPQGSLCWGSGYQAQLYDFGALKAHAWHDILNSRTIVLWGRDPASTHIHLLPYLKQARERGARVVHVNPIQTASYRSGDIHVAPRPGTDGALALGLAHIILQENLHDQHFIDRYTHGFSAYRELVAQFTPHHTARLCGLTEAEIRHLALLYAGQKPAAILLGYGLQRYANGGQTIRAIDALAALTGQIGRPGGGVNYANQYWKNFFADITCPEAPASIRFLPWPVLAQAMLEAANPPIKAAFVTRSNPLTQLPDTALAQKAFAELELLVVNDFFLTDTARLAHYVLPCTTFLEEEDLFCCSWNPYLNYARPAVVPLGKCKPDWLIFSELAAQMQLDNFPRRSARQWLEELLEPAQKHGFTLDSLAAGPLRHPLAEDVPWADGRFATPSGKFEFYSQAAVRDGVNPLPVFEPAAESIERQPDLARFYPLHFITPHHRDFLHSQFYNLDSEDNPPEKPPGLFIHPQAAAERGIAQGDTVLVTSPRGKINATACLTEKVRPDTVYMHSGNWHSPGGCVNALTCTRIPDMGLGTPHYDCRCQVIKPSS